MRDAITRGMSLFKNLFAPRSRGWNPFARRTTFAQDHRRGMALGTLASLAAPFIIRKLMARRQQRGFGPAY